MLHKNRKLVKAAAVTVFIVYVCCLIYFLFFSERYGRNDAASYYRYNLRPFKEITRFWTYRDIIGFEMVMVNLVGNVAVFMPFGFLLPAIYEPLKKWYAIILVGMWFSIIIECVQLITKVGTMDVDDVILNVTGVMLGLVFYKFCSFCMKKRCKAGA